MPRHCFTTAFGTCALSWDGDELTGFALPPAEGESTPLPAWLQPVVQRVQRHLQAAGEDFANLPYAWSGVSDFQRQIYQAALQVKSGQTATYGALARAIGQPPAASRAVGTALGQNPWPLLVPCHRFVGADGRMTGFSAPGGIATKLKLLALEGSELFGA